MAGKELPSSYPTVPANINEHAHNDIELVGSAHNTRNLRKKKRNKCILYIILFAIIQFAIIAVLATTILKVQTPRFRIQSGTFNSLNTGTPTNQSLSARLNIQLTIRNTNFGRYRYQNTIIQFLYRAIPIGNVNVRNGRVGWRTTSRFVVNVDLSLAQGDSQLASDLSSGIVPITSQASMRGRAEIVYVLRRNRGTTMNCSMEMVRANEQLRNIVCR